MVNQRLVTQAAKIAEAIEHRKEERDRRQLTKGLPRLVLLQPNTPTYFSILNEFFLDLYVHNVWVEPTEPGRKGRMIVRMCHRMYADDPTAAAATDDCEDCQLVDDKGRKNPSIRMKFLLSYVHSREGATYKGTDGKDYEQDPVGIIQVRAGKGAVNFQKMDELNRKNAFKLGKCVFQISKDGTGKETTYSAPSSFDQSLLGEEFDPRSEGFKEALTKYSKKTPDEIIALVLNNLTDVDWEWAGVDRPVADVVESSSEEVTTTPTKKQAKDGLG